MFIILHIGLELVWHSRAGTGDAFCFVPLLHMAVIRSLVRISILDSFGRIDEYSWGPRLELSRLSNESLIWVCFVGSLVPNVVVCCKCVVIRPWWHHRQKGLTLVSWELKWGHPTCMMLSAFFLLYQCVITCLWDGSLIRGQAHKVTDLGYSASKTVS